MEFVVGTYRDTYGMTGYPIHDACAVAAVIDRNLLTLESCFATVETKGDWTYGRTVCDLKNRLGREPNAQVALDINGAGVLDLVYDAIVNSQDARAVS